MIRTRTHQIEIVDVGVVGGEGDPRVVPDHLDVDAGRDQEVDVVD